MSYSRTCPFFLSQMVWVCGHLSAVAPHITLGIYCSVSWELSRAHRMEASGVPWVESRIPWINTSPLPRRLRLEPRALCMLGKPWAATSALAKKLLSKWDGASLKSHLCLPLLPHGFKHLYWEKEKGKEKSFQCLEVLPLKKIVQWKFCEENNFPL